MNQNKMKKDLSDKTAIVTGANRGMGYAMADVLASRGATVILACRKEEAGLAAEKKLVDKGLAARFYQVDMESTESISSFAQSVLKNYPIIDILINNAAVNLGEGGLTIETMTQDILDRTMDINFRGVFWMCREFVSSLKRSKSGRIINFSSGLGQLGVPRMGPAPAYSISKTAVNAVTKILDDELKDTDVIVTSVDPGWIKTGLGGPLAPGTLEQGIDTPIWLATAPADEIEAGNLYKERGVICW